MPDKTYFRSYRRQSFKSLSSHTFSHSFIYLRQYLIYPRVTLNSNLICNRRWLWPPDPAFSSQVLALHNTMPDFPLKLSTLTICMWSRNMRNSKAMSTRTGSSVLVLYKPQVQEITGQAVILTLMGYKLIMYMVLLLKAQWKYYIRLIL